MKHFASARMGPCLFLVCFFLCDVSFSRHLDLITQHAAHCANVSCQKKKSRDDSLSWNLSRVKQGGAIRADDMDPQDRGQVHVTARLNGSGSERPARTRSCNDAKQLMDRHENDK